MRPGERPAGLAGIALALLLSAPASWNQEAAPPPQTGPAQAPSVQSVPARTAPAEATAPSAATTGQISGSVMTPRKKPVRGASVGLIPEGKALLYGSSTDEEGRYALKNLEPGTYAVLVMDPGGNVLRKERVNARPLFRNLVDFVTEPKGSPLQQIPSVSLSRPGSPTTLDITVTLVADDDRPIAEGWILLHPLGVEAPAIRAMTDGEGRARLLRVQAAHYRITGHALGHVTWELGPLWLEGGRDMTVRLTLLPFALGEPEDPMDLLVPLDPIPLDRFQKEP